jgi:3-oxoacyl-[acyl-carrier protein] reductase
VQIDIAGKVVAVTGAGRGIGRRLAERFVAEGTRVFLLEREQDSLAEVAGALRKTGGAVDAIQCDVAVESQVKTAFQEIEGKAGRLDVLINNAGVAHGGTVEELSAEHWDDSFGINTRGVFLCAKAAIPIMKRQNSGSILNAASFATIIPGYGMASYSAAKAAVASLTRTLAGELGPWNITVNAYAPGMIPTRLSGYANITDERRKQLFDTLAFPRWGDPDEIADLLIFLSSDRARYLTGALIDISGGKFAVQFPQMAHAAKAAKKS